MIKRIVPLLIPSISFFASFAKRRLTVAKFAQADRILRAGRFFYPNSSVLISLQLLIALEQNDSTKVARIWSSLSAELKEQMSTRFLAGNGALKLNKAQWKKFLSAIGSGSDEQKLKIRYLSTYADFKEAVDWIVRWGKSGFHDQAILCLIVFQRNYPNSKVLMRLATTIIMRKYRSYWKKKFPKIDRKNAVLLFTPCVDKDYPKVDFLKRFAKMLSVNQPDSRLLIVNELLGKVNFKTPVIAFPFRDVHWLSNKDLAVNIGNRIRNSNAALPVYVAYKANLRRRYPGMRQELIELSLYTANDWCRRLLDVYAPSSIIIWNQFTAFHNLVAEVAKKRGLSISYLEYGCLPGSFCLETAGQMGESFPAVNGKIFNTLPVTKIELEEAEQLLAFLYHKKLNRKEQP
ncbi:MAG: hypothetical protein LBC40_06745, partial [Dysgonamonadaceae bacterium]|nr:hypothetical protein [Dysgonamonadaceae bacterium]